MLTDIEMLDHIYQSTDMGISGVQSVLRHTADEKLRRALLQQLREYEKISGSAQHLLEKHNLKPRPASAMAKLSSRMMTAMKSMTGDATSKIAEMMIQGSTMGVTKGIRQLNEYGSGDHTIRDLGEKLLATEESNIEQMKIFL